MGASVVVYWPGISDEQTEASPGFWNDCKAWGDWMAEREQHPEVVERLRQLGVDALLTAKTDGVDDADVAWVKPEDLRSAAIRLRDLVLAGHPEVRGILETYAKSDDIRSAAEDFAQDLGDVAEIAEFAAREQVPKITLEVNW